LEGNTLPLALIVITLHPVRPSATTIPKNAKISFLMTPKLTDKTNKSQNKKAMLPQWRGVCDLLVASRRGHGDLDI
jgi:hypothetical protein